MCLIHPHSYQTVQIHDPTATIAYTVGTVHAEPLLAKILGVLLLVRERDFPKLGARQVGVLGRRRALVRRLGFARRIAQVVHARKSGFMKMLLRKSPPSILPMPTGSWHGGWAESTVFIGWISASWSRRVSSSQDWNGKWLPINT